MTSRDEQGEQGKQGGGRVTVCVCERVCAHTGVCCVCTCVLSVCVSIHRSVCCVCARVYTGVCVVWVCARV